MENPGRDGGREAYEGAARSGLLRALLLRVRQLRPAEELTVHCAWCNRIKRGEEWVFEELRAVRSRRRGGGATHGICPDCLARVTALPRK
jgi:hypothetical protein